MKYLFCASTLLISLNTFGFDLCERLASESGNMKVPQNCRHMISKAQLGFNQAENSKHKVYGYRNTLFIDSKSSDEKQATIAGDKTLLNEIKAVTFDEKFIYVLNHYQKNQDQILVFKKVYHGNVSPNQVIDLGQDGCQHITKPNDKKHYFAKCGDKVLYGLLKGDSRYSLAQKKPEPAQNISLERLDLSDDVHIKNYKGQLLILDKKQDILRSYSSFDSFKKMWEINLQTEGLKRAPASIEIEQEGFSVKDINGEKLYYK